MPQIPYDMSNMQKCRCSACPVHANSACIKQRMAGMQMQPGMLPDPSMMEGLYCTTAVGKSRCNDLDSSLACICPTCAVWQENGLVTNYFCLRGPAQR
jgi:hypothetical protein